MALTNKQLTTVKNFQDLATKIKETFATTAAVEQKLTGYVKTDTAEETYQKKSDAFDKKFESLTGTDDVAKKTEIAETYATKAQVASAYKPSGNIDGEGLKGKNIEANLGNLYNLTENVTTDANWMDGAGKTIVAGTNVGIVKDGDTYKFDALAGFIDTSKFVEEDDLEDYVTKETGKGLYPNEDKEKLAGIEIATDADVEGWLATAFQ